MFKRLAAPALLALVILTAIPTFAQKTSTGQSIMTTITNSNVITFTGTEEYWLNKAAAGEYFMDSVTSGPVVDCSGSTTNCSLSNKPSASAPAADYNELMKAVRANACTFRDGGLLATSTYEQTITVSGLNGKGNWRFVWTYTIAPKGTAEYPNPVDPMTAWYLHSSDVTDQNVTINGFIAGLSGISSKQWNHKYSFSLLDSEGLNRVTDVVLTVTGSDGTYSLPVTTMVRSNIPGTVPGDPGAVDFLYLANGGTNGNISVLPSATLSPSAGLDGRFILNTDDFAGNNNGGADGSALSIAEFSVPRVHLFDGTNTITVTGVVKANGMNATMTFSVTYDIDVIKNCMREYPN